MKVVHVFHGVRFSSVAIRYFVGVNCLPIKLRIVWVDRSLICVNVVGLWRACSSLCISVCVLSSVMGMLSSVCVSAQVLMSSTASYLFAFHWLMHKAFLFLVEGERCLFFWAWLVTHMGCNFLYILWEPGGRGGVIYIKTNTICHVCICMVVYEEI